MIRLNVVLLAFLTTSACIASAPLAPTEGPWRFSGTVSALNGGQVGSPIAGAQLTIIKGPDVYATASTDGQGHYVFASLEGGNYSLSIAASGYVTATPTVQLFTDTEANFVLKPQ